MFSTSPFTPARADVQGSNAGTFGCDTSYPSGTIEWWEHLQAWEKYKKSYAAGQSALVVHQRFGFSYSELILFLGHHPRTWVANT